MSTQWNSVLLNSLGVLRVRGADAVTFLQGQLSNDVKRLDEKSSLLGGYHNPQGRAIALLRLVQLAPGDLLAILPRELVGVVAARLGKFVLRAKVTLADESALWTIDGLLAQEPLSGAAHPQAVLLPQSPGGVRRVGDTLTVRPGESPGRLLLIRPAPSPGIAGLNPISASDWRLAAIGAGEPQVYAATSEEFVAQMLNLDVLNAIAFDKGCYTGQEVIARAHYRGRVKRRMQRFSGADAEQLSPGDTVTLADRRQVKVVEAARRADGRWEFLAVGALAPEAQSVDAGAPPVATLSASPLPLPYALPE